MARGFPGAPGGGTAPRGGGDAPPGAVCIKVNCKGRKGKGVMTGHHLNVDIIPYSTILKIN